MEIGHDVIKNTASENEDEQFAEFSTKTLSYTSSSVYENRLGSDNPYPLIFRLARLKGAIDVQSTTEAFAEAKGD